MLSQEFMEDLENDERYYAEKKLQKKIDSDIQAMSDVFDCLYGNTSRC